MYTEDLIDTTFRNKGPNKKPPRPVSGPPPSRPATQPVKKSGNYLILKHFPNVLNTGPYSFSLSVHFYLSPIVGPKLPRRPGPDHPLFHYVVEGPHAIALFDYESTHADELSFRVSCHLEY